MTDRIATILFVLGWVALGFLWGWMARGRPKPAAEPVIPSSGCIMCDLKFVLHNTNVGPYHETQHGFVPCTRRIV